MPRLAANLSFLFKEHAFLDRFAAAAASGFRAVEFMFPGDGGYIASAEAVAEQLKAHQLEQVLLNAPGGDWANGERGLGGLGSREADWQASIETGLRYCRHLGCPRMHVMAGMVAHGATEEVFVKRLQWAAELAVAPGKPPVTLLVEPLNPTDFPGYLVPDAETALRIIEHANASRPPDAVAPVQLQLDVYHLAQTEAARDASVVETVRRLLPHAAHVQFANPPGRNEPGVGTVDFERVCAALDDAGYAGHVGLEYKPSTSATVQSLVGWGGKHGLRG